MPQTCSGAAVPGCLRRPGRWRVALLVGLAWSWGLVSGVPAATTWTVCAGGCDYASIKAAIAAPTTLAGDTLAIAAGTYTEAGITVNKSLTLQGKRAATTFVQAAAAPKTGDSHVIAITSGVTVTLQNLTIRHGRTPLPGGGLQNSGTATLINCIVSNNSSVVYEGGGAGVQNWGILTLINSTLSGNSADGGCIEDKCSGFNYGGGLNNDGTATLINSTVSGNRSDDAGGGIANWATLMLINSTVSGNSASSGGGGLVNSYRGTLTLINSTVSGNSTIAGSPGGGLQNDGTATLTHSTVSGNSALSGGGLHNTGRLTLTNSLIANHPQGKDCAISSPGSITSRGYNLDSDGSCQLTTATDQPGVDPLLGPLQDNGGPTFTQALLPGSPAIDAIPWDTNGCGTTHIGDQRWQARPQPAGGACDSGAYEVEVPGQALGAWVTGFTPQTVVCQNVTTAQVVTLSDPVSPWDCEAVGLGVSPGDRVAIHVRGPVKKGATDVGGAVAGMAPTSGGCTNLTTEQQVPFQHLVGATAASCLAAGLVVQPGDHVQMSVQGVVE
jgi:hypothetical protein